MTVAVMTRIQLIEAPFLNEFVSWYLQLGFSKVYFINTEPANEQKIKQFIDPELLTKVTFVNHTRPTNNFTYLRQMFTKTVTEDYVMHADSDEYLMLPKKYQTIDDLVNQHKYDLYCFRWVDVPVDDLYQKSMTEYLTSPKATGRFCGTHKMMVRRSAWLKDPRASCDPHSFTCRGTKHIFQDPAANGNIPFYIHFLVRGYLHTVIKVFEQRLPTERGRTPKQDNKSFATTDMPMKKYPFRVLSACGEYCICSRSYVASKLVNWRIPEYTPRNLEPQTLELYTHVFAKYGIQITENILEKDVFNLTEKFSKCNAAIMQKHRPKLVSKLPSHIGIYLQKNI